MADAEKAAKRAGIRVRVWENNRLASILQRTTNLPMTYQHADDLLGSGEDSEFLHENSMLHIRRSMVQRMINFSMLRYENSQLRRLTDGVVRETVKNFIKTATQ